MLFIMQPKELSKWHTLLLYLIPTAAVFLSFFGLIIWSALSARSDLEKERSRASIQAVTATEQAISNKLAIYEEVLRAGSGLFRASENVSRQEWTAFSDTLELNRHSPGIQALAYTELVTKESKAVHEQRVRNEGYPDYKIFPESDKEIYSPIIYVEPFHENNLKAFGFDLLSQTPRKQALDKARDENTAVLSEIIQLVQDDHTGNGRGLMMAFPIYDHQKPIKTVEERRAAIKGFVYTPFRTLHFFGDIQSRVSVANPEMKFQIYSGKEIEPSKLLYESPGFAGVAKPINQNLASHMKVNDGEMTILYRIPEESIAQSIRKRPLNTLIGGTIFSVVLAGFVLTLLINRGRALRYAEESEVQQAKDDLLSLASHQLRTPATGVKQYIGMLRQGYAGKLTKIQTELLEKAYQSNERQLGIIDEILHVARIDTGRINLNLESIELTKLIRDVVIEQHNSIVSKEQKLRLHLPRKKVTIAADPQYLRMVVENLISNATKYTDRKGRIDVTLKSTRDKVVMIIKDNGVGISKNEQPLLFQKFSRIHNHLTRQTEGSGIGLYITKRVVDLHEGTIEVDSEPDEGTTFTITLPKVTGKETGNV